MTETRRLGQLVTRLFDVALVQHGRLALRMSPWTWSRPCGMPIDTARVLVPRGPVPDDLDASKRAHHGGRAPAPAGARQRAVQRRRPWLRGGWPGDDRGQPRGRGGARGIVDEGPGIPRSIIDAEFRPFTRGEPTGDGLGLGLYLAHEIVEAHGGRIVFSSGRATAPTPASSSPSRSGDGAQDHRAPRVIAVAIVEDHPAIAEGLAALIGAEPDIDIVWVAGSNRRPTVCWRPAGPTSSCATSCSMGATTDSSCWRGTVGP